MKYTIETIKEMARKNSAIRVIYFWGHTPNPKKMTAACFSQWYDCLFEEEVYQEIMAATSPSDYKKLGRKVRGFIPEPWDVKKYDIVVEGNKAKFGQNPAIREFLLSTGDAILAEASPYDTIWGIGLDRETAQKGTVEQWQGENLLGCALMEVRDWLISLELKD